MDCKIQKPKGVDYFYERNKEEQKAIFEIFDLKEREISLTLSYSDIQAKLLKFVDWLNTIVEQVKLEKVSELGSAPIKILDKEVILNIYENDFHEFIYDMQILYDELSNLNKDELIHIEVYKPLTKSQYVVLGSLKKESNIEKNLRSLIEGKYTDTDYSNDIVKLLSLGLIKNEKSQYNLTTKGEIIAPTIILGSA